MTVRPGVMLAGIVAAACLAVLFWRWREPDGGVQPVVPAPQLDPAAEHDLVQKMLQQVEARQGADPARTEVPPPAPDVPRVHVRVLDASSRQALPGTLAVDLARGEVVATADARGELDVPVLGAGRLAFRKPDYLTRLVVHGSELAAAFAKGGVVEVELTRDDFTLPLRLRFARDGAPFPGDVAFTVTCLDSPPPSAGSFPGARLAPGEHIPAELLEEWRQHTLVAMLPGGEDPDLHLGLGGHGRVFHAREGAGRVRLIARGRYRVDASAAAAGLAGQAEVLVDLGRTGPFDVPLAPGRMARGNVLDAGSKAPIAGARVRLVSGGVGAAEEVATDADGAFALGPLPGATAEVEVRARCYDAFTGTIPTDRAMQVTLTPLPRRTVRGVVRARASLQPIAGAEVEIRTLGERDATARTGADGTFALETCAESPELRVRAAGMLPWLELLQEPVASYECDLVPADAEARLATGLIARVSGRVLRADGTPAAGLPVQMFSEESHLPQGIAGRTILEGHGVPVLPVAVAAGDGTFTLDWAHAGPVTLVPTDGKSTAADGVVVNLVLGQHLRDVTLHAR